jgi:5-methylcytosine-specific restriction protein A
LVDTQTGKKHPRNIMVSKNALILAKHQCEYDNSHGSFKRKAPPHFMYTEPHHLIPLTLDAYNDFENSLDVEENICSLCSTCHKCLHYGSIDERDRILEKLLEERQPFLCAVGLEITLDSLRKYY